MESKRQRGRKGQGKEHEKMFKRPRGGGDWSSIHDDLLEQIFKLPLGFSDHVSLRSLCANWRSFALLRNTITPQFQSSPMPLLLLQLHQIDPQSDGYLNSPYRSFFSLLDNKVHNIYIPRSRHKYCRCSSQGWLVLSDKTSPSITILNPFTGAQIQLPPVTTFPGIWHFDFSQRCREYSYKAISDPPMYLSSHDISTFFISKLVLAPNPSSANYTAMVIFGMFTKYLAFCKSGQNKWTLVPDITSSVIDVIHCKGQFYVCTAFEGLYLICNLDGFNPSPMAKEIIPRSYICGPCDLAYLGELFGELILVVRRIMYDPSKGIGHCHHTTVGIEVYKIDESIQNWVPMKSIGNRALFVGAKSVLASDSAHCRANCIYFSEDTGPRDFGVYSLERCVLEPFPSSCPVLSGRIMSAPIWFTPSLC